MTNLLRRLPALIAAAGLGVDAWTHLDLAPLYALNRTSTLSQGDLFRVEAVMAIVAAVALLARPRRWSAALAALVALGGIAALVLYRYVDVGRIGPLPDMYEPIWYREKVVSLIGEAIAALGALGALALAWPTTHPARPRVHAVMS